MNTIVRTIATLLLYLLIGLASPLAGAPPRAHCGVVIQRQQQEQPCLSPRPAFAWTVTPGAPSPHTDITALYGWTLAVSCTGTGTVTIKMFDAQMPLFSEQFPCGQGWQREPHGLMIDTVWFTVSRPTDIQVWKI